MPTQDVRSIEATTLHRRRLRLILIHMAVLVTKFHNLVITPTMLPTIAITDHCNRQLRMFRTLREPEWSRNTGEARPVRPCTRLVATTQLLRLLTWAVGVVRQLVRIRHHTDRVYLPITQGPIT